MQIGGSDNVDYFTQGLEAFKNADYFEALKYFDELYIYENSMGNRELYDLYLYKADCYIEINNYREALKFYNKCVDIAEKLGEMKLSFDAIYKIIYICGLVEDYDMGIENAERARKIAFELNDKLRIIRSYNALAAMEADVKDEDDSKLKALELLKKALSYAKDTTYYLEIVKIASNMAEVYCRLGKAESSIKCIEDSNALLKYVKEDLPFGIRNAIMADSYLQLGKLDTALIYAERALKFYQKAGNKIRISEIYSIYYKIYEKNHDFEKALKYHVMYTDLLIESKNSEQLKIVESMKMEYDLLKAEKDREIYKLKNEQLEELNKKLQEAYDEVNRLSQKDFLTSIYNRRGLKAKIKDLYKYSENGIILFDIDFFKKINDGYGHDVGDKILQKVVSRIHDIKDEKFILGRWGGEEFIIIYPNKNIDETFELANKVSAIIRDKSFNINDYKINVTITSGIDTFKGYIDFERALRAADDKLYIGKEKSRNINIK